MNHIDAQFTDDVLTIHLKGHIDSGNAPDVEQEIAEARSGHEDAPVVLNCADLAYISSAGLRVILRLKKLCPDTKVTEVSPEVYEIFDVTGFTEIIDVSKAYRVLSVEGCEVIGQGANGKVYRIDPDTVVKVYFNADALPEIHRERELARAAFVSGIPTAIPYDVVRVGDGYGSVFELLNATSFAKLLINKEKTVDEVAQMSVDLLKLIHSTEVDPEVMPSMRDVAIDWARFLNDYLEPELAAKLVKLVEDVPEDNHMMHGDYHIKNVMLQNGEVLLIDMDTLCHGHPVFELASVYNAYQGYSDTDHGIVLDFIGIDWDTSTNFWNKTLELYLGTTDSDRIKEVEEKAQIVGYTRIMRRSIRRNGLNTPEGRAVIDNARTRLEELVPKYDTLLF
ncbi:MAG: anti-sigma factor antagonist [Atopobiaceae bacterium]|nr:anti-sigma factor antagonist [Atopobiaceae bacterium]